MKQYISTYIATIVTFLALDGLWLGFFAKDFFQTQLADFMIDSVNIPVALLFYLVYVVGIIIFVIKPGLEKGNAKSVFMYGALFGFICYAAYDLTNLATLQDWPIPVVIVDLIWGTLGTGASAVVGYWVSKKFK